MKKKIHIFRNDKFVAPYIEFINNNFEKEKHLFLIFGGINRKIKSEINIKKIKDNNSKIKKIITWFIFFEKEIYSAEKIILHGLFNPIIVKFIFFQPWLLKKCNWIVWGGDLYVYQKPKLTVKSKIYEFMRAFCIKRFRCLITYLEGDYKLTQEWYGARGYYLESIMYPSNIYREVKVKAKEKNSKIYIQVGNSGDPSNNHIEIFKKLEKYKEEEIEVICPLSYGDKENIEKVIKKGIELFGNKFNPLVEFLSLEKYLEVLGKVDIAIFNHKRQQAMGNTITLLGLGKKVYLRSDTTTWKLFEKLDIEIFDSKLEIDLEKLELKVKDENKIKIKKRFSEKEFKKEWERIFNE